MKDCPKFILLIFISLFAMAFLIISYFVMVKVPDPENFEIKVFEKTAIEETSKILLSELLVFN